MTTKFRVETVMTTSIHLRMRSAEDGMISQTLDIIPQTLEKCNTFFKKVLRIFKKVGKPLDKTLTPWYNTHVWDIPR